MKLVIWPPVDEARLRQISAVDGYSTIVNAESAADVLREIVVADCFFGRLLPEFLVAAQRLKWVQSPTASLEHYLFPELIEHPCVLTNMRGLFSDVIADHVMSYVLCFARNLNVYLRQQQRAHWEPVGGEQARTDFLTGPGTVSSIDRAHQHLSDLTMGIVGCGHIGAEVARRAAAFGMTLRGIDPQVSRVAGLIEDVRPVAELPELLGSSDYVVIAAPHTPVTERMFQSREFAQMKNTAVLINIGRGIIVSLDDLTHALQSRQIGGAALDVFETEPLPPAHPLWDMENVIITPHIAAASIHVAERHLQTLLENMRRFAAQQELLTPVNKHAWF